jgi:hypothetical protein
VEGSGGEWRGSNKHCCGINAAAPCSNASHKLWHYPLSDEYYKISTIILEMIPEV